MSKHTPEPWGYIAKGPRSVTLTRKHWSVGSDSTNEGVALVFGDTEDNVRLIAAAPKTAAERDRLKEVERLSAGGLSGICWEGRARGGSEQAQLRSYESRYPGGRKGARRMRLYITQKDFDEGVAMNC